MSSPTGSPGELLSDALCARAGDAGRKWLDKTVAAAIDSRFESLPMAYTAAPRAVGRSGLALTELEERALASQAPGHSFADWTIFDAARAVLLLELGRVAPADAFVHAATACYELGDAREQQSWLKAVGLMPQPERFLPSAIDACRTNILPLFESIACENPYPLRHFPELNFNQLVLKALFLGVALTRVVGLRTRLNPQLSRMARDYAAERRAAGRTVPGDLPLAILGGALVEEQVR